MSEGLEDGATSSSHIPPEVVAFREFVLKPGKFEEMKEQFLSAPFLGSKLGLFVIGGGLIDLAAPIGIMTSCAFFLRHIPLARFRAKLAERYCEQGTPIDAAITIRLDAHQDLPAHLLSSDPSQQAGWRQVSAHGVCDSWP